ncbi:MAG: class I SAM-dependent methyltransferase [Alphaproteobacteria bacterium]|nr:class I SAM-dependent methyltransferase [Alphaproteobacteria bacterium]MBM3952339.1 class I SAM-dependent methyltransferase [Rhodospirillales bacterium]
MTPIRPDWVYPENIRNDVTNRVGVYDAYRRYADGSAPNLIGAHAIIDDTYARLYAENLALHLASLHLPDKGTVLDIGSGPGTVTAALAAAQMTPTYGIDIDDMIVGAAASRYRSCKFIAGSADDLSTFSANSLRLIHAREFYPFSRAADPALHLRFLKAAASKLVDGGLFVVVQIVDKAGLHNTIVEVREGARELGYRESGCDIMVPQRAFRRFGKIVHLGFVYPLIANLGRLLEMIRPGLITYIYWFRCTKTG